MRPRPWHLLLVLVALLVPIQAGALKEDQPVRVGGGLSVSASLDHCGVGGAGITCKINVSWTGVEGAERYTASVTLADGSVRELGTIGTGPSGGFSSIWVPYAGDGSYSVTITAWGTDPEGKEKELDSDEAEAEGKGDREGKMDAGSVDEEKADDEKPEDGGENEDKPKQPQEGDGGKPAAPEQPQGEKPPANPEPTEPAEPTEPPAEVEAPAEQQPPAKGEAPAPPSDQAQSAPTETTTEESG